MVSLRPPQGNRTFLRRVLICNCQYISNAQPVALPRAPFARHSIVLFPQHWNTRQAIFVALGEDDT